MMWFLPTLRPRIKSKKQFSRPCLGHGEKTQAECVFLGDQIGIPNVKIRLKPLILGGKAVFMKKTCANGEFILFFLLHPVKKGV